ncbi:MAG TPA: hypothetical protein VKB03_01585 [Conexibacter sp.]|nr:hypothetical protein [Conexibacter sp.]
MPRVHWIPLAALPVLVAAGVQFSGAAFVASSADPSNALSAHSDWSVPTASASAIARTTAGATGSIKAGASYYVYANASDTGNPASGVASVTTNVSALTSAGGTVSLTAGSYAVGAATYAYRSAAQTAKSSLAAGSYAYTLTLADAAANSGTQSGFSVTVDATAPSAADVQSTNVAGGTAGKPDAGDQIVLTFSEPIDPSSILAGWTGATASVVVRITEGGAGNDALTIRNSTNSAQLPLGSVNLARTDFVTATRDFGASGTAATMVQSGNAIALTLGTPSGTTGTAAGAAAMIWTPVATATDVAGNAAATTARTETGTADLDF